MSYCLKFYLLILLLSASPAVAAEGGSHARSEHEAFLSALCEALQDDHSDIRQASWILDRIGLKAGTVVAALLDVLGSQDRKLRLTAIRILGDIGPEANTAVTVLTDRLLKDKDGDMRQSAAIALGKIGTQDRAAVAALISTLSDESPYLRAAAATALGSICPQAREVLPALAGLLKNPDKHTRDSAAGAITRIRNRHHESVTVFPSSK